MPGLIVTPKFVWQRIVMSLPSSSPYFRHEKCVGCKRSDGSQIRAATIVSICFVMADAVNVHDPESRVYRSTRSIAHSAKRKHHTVIAVLGHLQTVGLLDRTRRGGGLGIARGAPSIYSLTVPDPGLLAYAGIDTDIMRKLEEDLQHAGEGQLDAGTEPYYRWFERTA